MEKIDCLLIGLILILIICLGSFLVMSDFGERIPYSIKFKIAGYSEEAAQKICNDRSLKETSYCLNSFVRGIFNYEDSNPENFQELISNGGVCRDYNKFYRTMLRKFGFKTEDIDVSWKTSKDEDWGEDDDIVYLGDGYGREGHIYLYTYDEDSSDMVVCTLDQTYINCREFN